MKRIVVGLVFALIGLECGPNQNVITTGGGPTPPENVKAYSSGPQSVTLSWTAPPEASDSAFWGYHISWNGIQDSVPKGTLTFTADPVPAGLTAFSLISKLATGETSSIPSTIAWAPADRFSDSTFTLYEFIQGGAAPAGPTAIYLSSPGGPPKRFPIDSTIQSNADFYLFGGTGGLPQTLQLYSADLYDAANHSTRFSTVTDASSTLDFPRSSFPGGSTYTNESVTATANTIYYVQLEGSSGAYYARVLITSLAGSSPGRAITMKLSVQRSPGIVIALAAPGNQRKVVGLGMFLTHR